jgi:CRP-like cAMP-binding protein
MSPLLGFDRYTSLAQCAEDCTILRIEAEPFRELLNRNAQVGAQVMNVIAQVYFKRYIDMLGRIQTIMGDITVR